MEKWKDIPGYEGAYQISDLGRVRSATRKREVNNCHGGRSFRTDTGRILTPIDNGHGYLVIMLSNDGHRSPFYIHRLVAEAFCEKQSNGLVIDHKNHNRADNRAINLEWVTQKENIRRSAHLMRRPKPRAKLPSTGERYIRRKGDSFKVCIDRLHIEKQFKSFDAAIRFREEVLRGAD